MKGKIMQDDILKALNNLIPEEIIDGSNVRDLVGMVDLGVAYKMLLVENPVSQDEFEICINIPQVVTGVKRDDGKYEIRSTDEITGPDFKILTIEETKLMRARFLLLKGFYSRNIDRLALPKQNEARSLYEIFYIPNL